MRKILVVEDDRDIAKILKMHLQDMGFEVSLKYDGTKGLDAALSGSFDMIILDIMLPGVDGLELCRKVRQKPGYVPILMLTAKSAEIDRVLGLEIGADDYLTKPFSLPELQARVRALFRRVEALSYTVGEDSKKIIETGQLVIDQEKRSVTLKGTPIHLTAKEFDLLVRFAETPGRVYTRSQLLDLVWNYSYQGYEHTVNSHINRLRAKIEEDPARPRYILTVWGVGYKFASRDD
ncbi:MAG: response regulator [Deltaproteobacteria bacterium]|nr:response regulator [Deltaproteobacteria bacterium]